MSLKILFMGTPDFAVPVSKSIHQSKYELLGVYTQPPKKKFRGQKVISSPIHQCAEKLKIPVRCPEDINTEKEHKYIKDLNLNDLDNSINLERPCEIVLSPPIPSNKSLTPSSLHAL